MALAFPVFLSLDGRPVVIAGGGELALRKARIARSLGAQLILVTPEPGPDLSQLADRIERRGLCPDDVSGAALVIGASGDPETDAQTSRLAQAAGVPVNVVDRPDLSTAFMPALVDRAPVWVAVGTGGAAPVLARRIREMIERLLPSDLGALAEHLEAARVDLMAREPDPGQRRRVLEEMADAVLAGRPPKQTARVGHVALVGAGPGDPDLLTLKALRALQNADVIVHDKLVDPRVLDLARRDARRIFVGKSKAQHTMAQDEINALLVREAAAGHRVVRLKGGDGYIFGRGGEEVEALREAGIAVEIVPGVTAALGCAASAEIPLTHRAVAHGLTLISGHDADSAPARDWEALARLPHTLAVYMGATRAEVITERLIAAGRDPATPVAVIENGTRSDERILTGRLADLPGLAGRVTGPAMLLIGEAVARGRIGLPALALAAE